MPQWTAARRLWPLALLSAFVMASAALDAAELSLSRKREFWTADLLYEDFLAEFGGDAKSCYIDYALREGPPPPDGPEAMGARWAIIAIDASGSMAGRVGGERKMDAAKAAVKKFLGAVPKDAEVGLLAFGHRGDNEKSGKAQSCAGVELLSAIGAAGTSRIADALETIQATGWTPLAAAIAKAGQSFTPASGPGEQVVFVVSDGLETCGGDPVAAAKALRESDVKAVVNIIGFDIPAKHRKALAAVAEAGGGMFSEAADSKELEERLRVDSAILKRKVAYDTAAMQVQSANNTSAVTASNHANNCVLTITNREATQFLEMSHRMVDNGQTDSASTREAYRRLRAHHDELRTEMKAFCDRAKAEMNAVNDRIQRDRERVKSAYGRN